MMQRLVRDGSGELDSWISHDGRSGPQLGCCSTATRAGAAKIEAPKFGDLMLRLESEGLMSKHDHRLIMVNNDPWLVVNNNLWLIMVNNYNV